MELTWNAFVDTALAHYRVNGWSGFYHFYTVVIEGIEEGRIISRGFDASDVCNFFSDVEDVNMLHENESDTMDRMQKWQDMI